MLPIHCLCIAYTHVFWVEHFFQVAVKCIGIFSIESMGRTLDTLRDPLWGVSCHSSFTRIGKNVWGAFQGRCSGALRALFGRF